jgi:hypothetical protein
MKKMKFDTLIESFLNEGTISNEERYGNVGFDLKKLSDKISDLESDDYKSAISPFIERWKEQGYLGNLTADQIKSILDEINTHVEELSAEGVETLPHSELKTIIDGVMRVRFKGFKEGMSVLATRWSAKFTTLFQKMKDTHTETQTQEIDQGDEDMGSLEGMESGLNKPTSAAEESLLKFIQGSDSVSREEAVDFLSRKSGMGREPEVANNIINSLISKKEIIETEDGKLEINTESGMIDSLASVSDDEDEIETGIPFRGRGIEDEDEDVADTFRRTTQGDSDFQRSNW